MSASVSPPACLPGCCCCERRGLRLCCCQRLCSPGSAAARLLLLPGLGVLPQATPQLTTQASLGFWHNVTRSARAPPALKPPSDGEAGTQRDKGDGPLDGALIQLRLAGAREAPGCCGRNPRRHLGPCRKLPWHRVAQRAAPGRCWARRAREKRPRTLGRRKGRRRAQHGVESRPHVEV